MKLKKYLSISNLLYIGSTLFAVGVLLKVMIERYQLPPGACPIDDNRLLLYIAIMLIISVNLGTFVYKYCKDKLTQK